MTKRLKSLSRMALVVLVAWLMGVAAVGTAIAGPFEDGVAAYGRGDFAGAAKHFREAAEQGDAWGQALLGSMYNEGQGVPQDYAEAVTWYRKAAEQGNASAQFNLGFMYDNGQGVPQDYVRAHKWTNLAVSRYPASEKGRREKAVKNRDIIAAKMTPAQVAEAQKLAREWKPKH